MKFGTKPFLRVPQLIVGRRFVCTKETESHAGGSVTTGRASHSGQVKEKVPNRDLQVGGRGGYAEG
jgi:hypothetical protein